MNAQVQENIAALKCMCGRQCVRVSLTYLMTAEEVNGIR